MKRAAIIVASIIAVIVVGLYLYLKTADFSDYKSEIEAAVAEETGREFRIDGDLTLDALPPVFVAEDVTWSNAAWGSDEPMLSVGHVTVRIDGSSLFFEPLVIEEFRLRDVRVLVETNAAGESNWAFDAPLADDDDDDGVEVEIEVEADSIVVLELGEVDNVTVIQRGPGAEDREFHIANLDVRITDENALDLAGEGRIDGRPVTLRGVVGPVDNLGSGENLDFDLDADFGFLSATARGNTGEPVTLEGTSFDALITSNDLEMLSDVLGLTLDLAGSLQADARIAAVDGTPTLQFNVSLDGLDIEGAVRSSDSRMRVDVTASSLPAIGAIAGVAGLPAGPASIKGDVLVDDNQIGLIDFAVTTSAASVTSSLNARIDEESIELDPFALQSGDSDLSGTLFVRTSEPMEIRGDIRSSLLDLTPYTGGDEAPERAADPAAAGSEFVLKEDPLPFEFLNAGNVDLSLLIEELRNGPLQLKDVEGDMKLEDGTLTVEGSLDVAAGGEADSSIVLVSQGDTATLDVDFDLSGFRPTQEVTDERPLEDIPLVGLTVDIESAGHSARTIAAASNGRIVLTQGPGKVDNSALGLVSSDIVSELFTALNPFAARETYSAWECTVVGIEFVDGVGTVAPMLAQSEKVTIVGNGTIDLNDESLDLGFNTKPRSGVGVSADMFLTPFVRLGGTLASPGLALDKTGVLISGGAAVLTGGLSFLVQGAADRATASEDQCSAALAAAQGREP